MPHDSWLYFTWYHHHHVVLPARISLTLARHSSLSFIAPGRSSGLHPVSSQSCCMYVRAGRPAFARPYEGVHRSTSLMSSSLLLQQCPACLVRLTLIVFMMGGWWPYSWCFVNCLYLIKWHYCSSEIDLSSSEHSSPEGIISAYRLKKQTFFLANKNHNEFGISSKSINEWIVNAPPFGQLCDLSRGSNWAARQ